jgi:uncharacterized BrkB/YihY/UPF0761 family membrane protein
MFDIVVMSAIVLGLVQLFKITTNINARYIPISALIISLGVLSCYAWVENVPVTWNIIENGIIIALSACGLWSGAKATIGK